MLPEDNRTREELLAENQRLYDRISLLNDELFDMHHQYQQLVGLNEEFRKAAAQPDVAADALIARP